MKMQPWTPTKSLLIGLLGWALAAPLSWAGGPVTELVVFGDSLSDSGNAFALQKENNTPPNYSVNPLLIPDDAYARGGHQFSNGPTWAEQFGKSLGLCQDVSPAFRDANPRATNYAVGGARARNDVSMNINLPIQVQVFLQDFGGSAPPDALYVIEIGGNDLRDALAAFGPNQDLPAALAVIAAGVSSVGNNISNLYQRGARNFLVWNGPDIGLTPAVRALGPGAVFVAGVLTQGYNGALATLLTGLGALPGIQIVEFDLYKTLNDIVADPSVSGLSDVTDACISPSNPPFVCKNPDSYLFWDGIHPTTVAHGILAQAVAKTLQ